MYRCLLLLLLASVAYAGKNHPLYDATPFINEAMTMLAEGYCPENTFVPPTLYNYCFANLTLCRETHPFVPDPFPDLASILSCDELMYFCPCNSDTVSVLDELQNAALVACLSNLTYCNHFCDHIAAPVMLPVNWTNTYSDYCINSSLSVVDNYPCDGAWWLDAGCPFPYACQNTSHIYIIDQLSQGGANLHYCDTGNGQEYVGCFDEWVSYHNYFGEFSWYSTEWLNFTVPSHPPEDVYWIEYSNNNVDVTPNLVHFECLADMILFAIDDVTSWTTDNFKALAKAPDLIELTMQDLVFADGAAKAFAVFNNTLDTFVCRGCVDPNNVYLDDFNFTTIHSFVYSWSYDTTRTVDVGHFFEQVHPSLNTIDLGCNRLTGIVDVTNFTRAHNAPNLSVFVMANNPNVTGKIDIGFCTDVNYCDFSYTDACSPTMNSCCNQNKICCDVLCRYTVPSCFNASLSAYANQQCDQSRWINPGYDCFTTDMCVNSTHISMLYDLADCDGTDCNSLGTWNPGTNSDYCDSGAIFCVAQYQQILGYVKTNAYASAVLSTIMPVLNSTFHTYPTDVTAIVFNMMHDQSTSVVYNTQCMANLRILVSTSAGTDTLDNYFCPYFISSFSYAPSLYLMSLNNISTNVASLATMNQLGVLEMTNVGLTDTVTLDFLPNNLVALVLINVVQFSNMNPAEPLIFSNETLFINSTNVKEVVFSLTLSAPWNIEATFAQSNLPDLVHLDLNIPSGLLGIVPEWLCHIQHCSIAQGDITRLCAPVSACCSVPLC